MLTVYIVLHLSASYKSQTAVRSGANFYQFEVVRVQVINVLLFPIKVSQC